MKKIYLLGAAFLISLGITGCTPATTTTPPASKPASTVEQQEKKYLSLLPSYGRCYVPCAGHRENETKR